MMNDVLQLTDDTRWAESALEEMKQKCLSSVVHDTSTWSRDSATGTLSLPQSVIKTLCPGDCNSDNGTCNAQGENTDTPLRLCNNIEILLYTQYYMLCYCMIMLYHC